MQEPPISQLVAKTHGFRSGVALKQSHWRCCVWKKKYQQKTTGLSWFSLFKWPYIGVIAHFQTHPNIISSHMKNHHVFVAEISYEATTMFRRVKSPKKSPLCRVLNPMKSQVLSSQSPWNHHFPWWNQRNPPKNHRFFVHLPRETQLDCCCLGCQAEEQKKHRRASLDKASDQEVTPDEWWP